MCAFALLTRELRTGVLVFFFTFFELLTGQIYSFESCARANSPPRGSDTTIAQGSVGFIQRLEKSFKNHLEKFEVHRGVGIEREVTIFKSLSRAVILTCHAIA